MDMDKLLALRTLAEAQIRAAEKLFCTQSALSKQINTLERELDCRLFTARAAAWCSTTAGRKPTPTLSLLPGRLRPAPGGAGRSRSDQQEKSCI